MSERPRLHHVPGTRLSGDTAQTGGMLREEAISGASVGSDRLWMGRTTVAPATSSADHHHGESETAIYVVSGHPQFVFPDGPAVVVIARTTQQAIVVNLPDLTWPRDAGTAAWHDR